MAPDTSLQPFVAASASSMSLPVIPKSPEGLRDIVEEEFVDPDAKLILSDFTQITEYFPMDLYRSMFFVNTLDHEYNRALDTVDTLARKLYDTSLPEETVSQIKLEMSRNINLMMANRNETLAEATRLYETVDQAFNTLDTTITVSEDNLLNPPSTAYFLPTPTLDGEDEIVPSDVGVSSDPSDDEDDDDAASVKTDDLQPGHLLESEIKALRRRMKKSIQWFPSPVCIKKELQTNGRWPVRFINKETSHRNKMAKLQRKRRREAQRMKREHVLKARKAAQLRLQKEREEELKKEMMKQKGRKNQAGVQYAMPVAANEPTYCYCGDVSYGEMIACENEYCPREWFHLECAGLSAAPKGKWYCRDCKPGVDGGNGSRKRKRA